MKKFLINLAVKVAVRFVLNPEFFDMAGTALIKYVNDGKLSDEEKKLIGEKAKAYKERIRRDLGGE